MIPSVFRIAVVDDDSRTRWLISEKLKDIFHSHSFEIIVSTFENSKDYLSSLSNHIYNLTFLDIEMPGMDGIELASVLNKKGYNNPVVFVSNREDRVFDSLETHPFGFVRKSNFQKDIKVLVNNFIESLHKEESKIIVIQNGKNQVTLYIDDIVYVDVDKKRTIFHLKDKKDGLASSISFQEIADELLPKGFLDCYKGILVNFIYIRVIKDENILLKNGESLPLSRRKVTELKEKYLNFIGDRLIKIY